MSVTTKRDLQGKVSSLTARLNQLRAGGASDKDIYEIEHQLLVAIAELEKFTEDRKPTLTTKKRSEPKMG